jgi:hypothetical protein
LAPDLAAIAAVSSADPPSTTTISRSRAPRLRPASVCGRVSAAFKVGITADIK